MRAEPRGGPKKPLDERLADEARFIKTWFENPVGTGAVSPSGRFLARAMARAVDPELPGPIVELGPGTGPVTDALIARGVDPRRLVLVEYDPHFCKLLQRRYPLATVIQGDAYDLAATLDGVLDEPAATVVSSLPLRNQPERHRLTLLEQAFAVLAPGGSFVQFTYGIASPMPLRSGDHPCFEAAVSPPVWFNLPPARVWVYRAAEAPALIRMRDGSRVKLKLRDGGPKPSLRFKARQARDEIKVHAERVMDGLKQKRRENRRSEPLTAAVPAKARHRPRGRH
ncbi:class I SAM-dependent methyltransferase [Lichenibacterium dinghuense]|uniref:class I SAM-dependent methyltransferase n=1 Tax=Lichenibacterium dinghuense TaxID=2895977 RepID=UPI001F47101F|nr:methyltransferase domain-containing protein [Lichenibacterium sp. 6Y81]